MKLTVDPTLEPEANGHDDIVSPGEGRKIFSVYCDFEIGDFKVHSSRLREAYRLAIAAAEAAVRQQFPEDAVVGLRTRMRYGYVQLEGAETAWKL